MRIHRNQNFMSNLCCTMYYVLIYLLNLFVAYLTTGLLKAVYKSNKKKKRKGVQTEQKYKIIQQNK